MATVGYLEGTDPAVLSKLAATGVGTLPLSNGFDAHGKYINHLTKQDGVTVVVGYLHKVLPYNGAPVTPQALLFACMTHGIPVLIVADKSLHAAARRQLGEVGERVTLVDPGDLYAEVARLVA